MSRRTSLLLPLALWVVLAGARVVAPSTLDDKDQPKVAFYTSDIVYRGKWILQYSDGVDVATKPPLYQWTVAAISLAVGKLDEFTLMVPSLVSTLLILFFVWDWGREFGQRAAMEGYFGGGSGTEEQDAGGGGNADRQEKVGKDNLGRDAQATGYELACLAALIWVTTYIVVRLEWTARTDMMTTACAMGAIWASNRLQGARAAGAGAGRRALWRWTFWGLITVGALTKGPVALGVAFAAIAAEAAFRKSWRPITDLWPWFGIPIATGVFALWFNAAWRAGGHAFWDTLVGAELVARVAGTGSRAQNARPFWYYVPIVFGRFLPWSVALAAAAPRWWKEGLLRPRRRHPFLLPAAWTIGIFVMFSIPEGKRPDYMLPTFAPAAVVAAGLVLAWLRRGWGAFGWGKGAVVWGGVSADNTAEAADTAGSGAGMAGWFASPRSRRRLVAAVFAVTALGIASYFFFGSEGARSHSADHTRQLGVKAYTTIEKNPGPILYCDPRSSLVQFYLRTNQAPLTIKETAEALEGIFGEAGKTKTGTTAGPVYVITRSSRVERLKKALDGNGGAGSIRLETLATAPKGDDDRGPLTLLRVKRMER